MTTGEGTAMPARQPPDPRPTAGGWELPQQTLQVRRLCEGHLALRLVPVPRGGALADMRWWVDDS